MGGPVRPRDTCCADEEWRPHRTVRRVEVSSCGRFRQAGRLLNEYRHKRGYLSVYLNDGKTRVLALSHREVLHAFAGPPSPERNSCNHKNGTKDDNHARNLEWTTTVT